MVITYTALGRMEMRDKGIKPYTFIGEICDKVFPNDYLYKKLPLMKPDD